MSDKLPNGWKECKLGEIATIKTGQTNSVDAVADGVYPLFDRSKDVKRSSKYLFDCEAVIVPGEGKDFIPRYYKGKFDLHQRAYAVIPNEQVCDGRYCYYALLDGRSYFSLVAVGSTVMSLRLSTFESFDILLPPLPEQRAIASVLSSLDDKIDLLHRENKTLETMAETLFRQWFIEENNTNKMIAVSNIASIENNNIKPAQKPRDLFYHYSISAFDKGQIPAMEFGETILSNKFIVLPNTILVSKLNPSTPRIWLIDDSVKQNSVCSTEFQILKPNEIQYIFFLYFLMKSDEVVSEFAMSATGTSGSHQRIRPEYILEIEAPIPEKSKLDTFNNICGPIMKQVKKNQHQTITLEKLRDTLLPKLMSGEVRIQY